MLIKDNQLRYFIPFQNMNFRNNWSDKINLKSKNLDEYILNKNNLNKMLEMI